MIYQVKVLNSKGEVQKILGSEQLSRNYWEKFRIEESQMGFKAANNAKLFKKSKKASPRIVS
jgi:hypothetical protein